MRQETNFIFFMFLLLHVFGLENCGKYCIVAETESYLPHCDAEHPLFIPPSHYATTILTESEKKSNDFLYYVYDFSSTISHIFAQWRENLRILGLIFRHHRPTDGLSHGN